MEITVDQINNLIKDALDARERYNAYNVSNIAYHVHDGVGSPLLNTVANSIPTVVTGILAPTITPQAIGNIFVNTALAKVYVATGTSSSSDWTVVN